MGNQETIRRIQDHIRVHKLKEPQAHFIHEALEKAIAALRMQPENDHGEFGAPVIAYGAPIGVVKRVDNRGFIECVLWDRFIEKSFIAEGFSRGALCDVHISCPKCQKETMEKLLEHALGNHTVMV